MGAAFERSEKNSNTQAVPAGRLKNAKIRL